VGIWKCITQLKTKRKNFFANPISRPAAAAAAAASIGIKRAAGTADDCHGMRWERSRSLQIGAKDAAPSEVTVTADIPMLRRVIASSARSFASWSKHSSAPLEKARAMGEQLLQAKAELAELRAEIRIKDAALKAEVQFKEAALQGKDVVIEAKDALIRRLQSELQRRDDAPAAAAAAQQTSARAAGGSAAPAPSSSFGRYAAPGKHVVSAAPQPAASTSALKRLTPDPPSILQRHKGFIYASAHVRDVDGQTVIEDGHTPVGIDAGFEVAPGDRSDVQVANAHAWGSMSLIFSDGTLAGSALGIAEYPSFKGIASYFSK
jgi:hypothetical protein